MANVDAGAADDSRVAVNGKTPEWSKARLAVLTATVSAIVSLVVAGLTSISTLAIQRQQAEAAFQLKAVEIVLSTHSQNQALHTARALREMFPERLPETFAKPFESNQLSGFGQDIVAAKTELLKVLPGKKPDDKREIIELWKALFSEDTTTFPSAR